MHHYSILFYDEANTLTADFVIRANDSRIALDRARMLAIKFMELNTDQITGNLSDGVICEVMPDYAPTHRHQQTITN